MADEIRIGFDDEIPNNEDESQDKPKKRGEVFMDLNEPYTPPYLSEERKAQLKEEMNCTVVHDFRDSYHLSEEDKEKRYQLYKYFKAVDYTSVKYKHAKLESYVKAMRKCIKCLLLVAENNGFYSPEEFLRLYFKGKIEISGFKFPRFTNRRVKKMVDSKFLAEFILSDISADEVEYMVGTKVEDVDIDFVEDDIKDNILSEEEYEKATSIENRDKVMDEEIENAFTFKDDDDVDVGVMNTIDKQRSIKLLKSFPQLVDMILDDNKRVKRRNDLSDMIYEHQFYEEDISKFAKFDRKYGKTDTNINRIPKFDGDISDSNAYHKYIKELDEYYTKNKKIYDDYGSSRTIDELNEAELKELLQSNNFNIRAFWDNNAILKKNKRADKRDRQELQRYKEILLLNQKIHDKRISKKEGLKERERIIEKYRKKGLKAKNKKKKVGGKSTWHK